MSVAILDNLLDEVLGETSEPAPITPVLLAALMLGVVMEDHSVNGGYGHKPQKPHQGKPGNDGKGQ